MEAHGKFTSEFKLDAVRRERGVSYALAAEGWLYVAASRGKPSDSVMVLWANRSHGGGLVHVRSCPHNGLNSDIAPCPRCAKGLNRSRGRALLQAMRPMG
jgi:hypothetical protein